MGGVIHHNRRSFSILPRRQANQSPLTSTVVHAPRVSLPVICLVEHYMVAHGAFNNHYRVMSEKLK